MTNKPIFTTRPTLASRLMQHGVPGHKVPNPWDPDRLAWEFDWSRDAQDIVNEYFAEHGTAKGGAD